MAVKKSKPTSSKNSPKVSKPKTRQDKKTTAQKQKPKKSGGTAARASDLPVRAQNRPVRKKKLPKISKPESEEKIIVQKPVEPDVAPVVSSQAPVPAENDNPDASLESTEPKEVPVNNEASSPPPVESDVAAVASSDTPAEVANDNPQAPEKSAEPEETPVEIDSSSKSADESGEAIAGEADVPVQAETASPDISLESSPSAEATAGNEVSEQQNVENESDEVTNDSAEAIVKDEDAGSDASPEPDLSAQATAEDENPEQPADESENVSAGDVEAAVVSPDAYEAEIEPVLPTELDSKPARVRKLSLLQVVLIAVVLLSTAMLTYSFVSSAFGPRAPLQADASSTPPIAAETSQATTAQSDSGRPKTKIGEVTDTFGEPVSLKLANDCYAKKDYDGAYHAYEQLRQNLIGREFDIMRDFLQLRMALCMEKKGDFDRTVELLRPVSQSRSVALKAVANYYGSLLDMNSGQFLNARMKAYRIIALTGLLASDWEQSLTLEQDSFFLVAGAVTREVLSLCDADKEIPQYLWCQPKDNVFLEELNETELQKVLNIGIEQLNSGLLAPQVRAVKADGTLNRWLVICNGPGIEELMARFAVNASIDVRWERQAPNGSGTEYQNTGWNRSVLLYLPSATTYQVVTTAAGAVGLLARVDDEGVVTISNPEDYFSLSEHTRMLNEHAIMLWRELLLTYNDEHRVPDGHFALGILQEKRNRIPEAIAEYKLVANRYPNAESAPFALLYSSRLKSDLRDYLGAINDLKQLIEEYPDNELNGQANLDLAQTTMKTGRYEEACSLYKKAYKLGFSTESRIIAAFGAGKCFYETNDYESAEKWLTRYLAIVRSQEHTKQTSVSQKKYVGADLYSACILLGKTNMALGRARQACDALRCAMRVAATSEEYIQAVSALVEAELQQENFVGALAAVENVRTWPFSQEQVTRMLLLKSSVLRGIGLTDQAIVMIADRAQYITTPRLRADINLELARCHVVVENLDLARSYFTEVLSMVEPGPVAHQTSLELAEVCLKLNDYEHTISICRQLLESSASKLTKQQASRILADAYRRQQDYEKAARVLLTASVMPDDVRKTGGVAVEAGNK